MPAQESGGTRESPREVKARAGFRCQNCFSFQTAASSDKVKYDLWTKAPVLGGVCVSGGPLLGWKRAFGGLEERGFAFEGGFADIVTP